MNEETKEILEGIAKNKYDSAVIYDIDILELLDYINNLQKENEELKMTNLALADDITKNKIIKQEVLTECCGIPIGEIPMLKIQNDEYKQRINKAIEYIEKYIIGNKLENVDWEFDDCNFSDMPVERIKPLIDILKGEK